MDVHLFFQRRIKFLRQLYSTVSQPYVTRKQLIEAEVPPFKPEPSWEEHEPAFLNEWLEADESLQVIGQMTVSALAAALHLFLSQSASNIFKRVRREKTTEFKPLESYKKEFKNNGWFKGYKCYFLEQLGVDFELSDCDLKLLESLVLTRNQAQHPEHLSTTDVFYSESDLKKVTHPFFIDANDLMRNASEDQDDVQTLLLNFMTDPRIKITSEKMNTVFEVLLKFAEWLEHEILLWSSQPLADLNSGDKPTFKLRNASVADGGLSDARATVNAENESALERHLRVDAQMQQQDAA